jgi:hypothetical protein
MKNDRDHRLGFSSEEIAIILSRYRASGLGLEQFARQQGIPPGRLHYWLYQKRPGPGAGRRAKPGRPAATPLFQEIQLGSRPEPVSRWATEVSLPSGLAVRFDPVATAEWIGAVVQTLQRLC